MEDYRRQNSLKSAEVAQKLCSMAKIVRLHENAKVAQKLRTAISQFSGGTPRQCWKQDQNVQTMTKTKTTATIRRPRPKP